MGSAPAMLVTLVQPPVLVGGLLLGLLAGILLGTGRPRHAEVPARSLAVGLEPPEGRERQSYSSIATKKA